MPVFMLFIAVFLSITFGYIVTSLLLPSSVSRRLTWTLIPGVGLAFSSLIFFLFRRPMFTVEVALALIGILVMYRFKGFRNSTPLFRKPSLMVLILIAALGLTAAGLMFRVERMPHGKEDGWAIWNTHARFLFRDGRDWENDVKYSFHGDYPILTSSISARFWRYAGSELPQTGALTGIVLALSAVALLAASIAEFRQASTSVLFALLLLATPNFLDNVTSQYADVPLAFFILSTLALICLDAKTVNEKKEGIPVLAGFMCGCAGWTKNEGLLFIAVTSFVMLFRVYRSPSSYRRSLAFFGGLALPLTAILIFKASITAQNDFIQFQHETITINKILDIGRHELILKELAVGFTSFGLWSIPPWIPLGFLILWAGIDRTIIGNSGWRASATILAMMLGGYYFAYLTTPQPLHWHLDSSVDRLILQLWPSFLLLLGLCGKRPQRDSAPPLPSL